MLWSYMSKYMFGSDGITWIRRPEGKRSDPKYQLPTVKHGGGSVMVWGCFLVQGMGPFITSKELWIATSTKTYSKMSCCHNLGRGVIYQDNDPKHCSKDVQEWFSW